MSVKTHFQSSAVLLHGKGGIGGKVHEYLLYFYRGGKDRVGGRRRSKFDLNGRGDGSPEELDCLLNEG